MIDMMVMLQNLYRELQMISAGMIVLHLTHPSAFRNYEGLRVLLTEIYLNPVSDGGPTDETRGRSVALGAGRATDKVLARDEQYRHRKIHADRAAAFFLQSRHLFRFLRYQSFSFSNLIY